MAGFELILFFAYEYHSVGKRLGWCRSKASTVGSYRALSSWCALFLFFCFNFGGWFILLLPLIASVDQTLPCVLSVSIACNNM